MVARPKPRVRGGLWRRMPPAVFSVILGLLGLGLAWRRGASSFGLPSELAEMVLGAILLLAGFAVFAYLAKVAVRPGVVVEDMRTLPGRGGLAAGCMSVYVAANVMSAYSDGFGRAILFAGFALHIALIVVFLRLVLTSHGDLRRVSPVWHLIFVGPVVGAVAAGVLGLDRIAQGLMPVTLAASVAIWGISAVQLLREDVPAPLRPLLAIHLAPAALHGQLGIVIGSGWLEQAGAILSVLILAALVGSLHWLLRSGFSAMWGAMTFPLAATAGLWLAVGGAWRIPGGILLVIATFFIVWVALRVLKSWATGDLAERTNAATA